MLKPLVIYHANCADGFGAAFAAWLKLGDEAEYAPMQYGRPAIDSMVGKDREVYILDFSLPKPQMERLFHVAKRVVWLDHHATSKFDMACFTEMSANCQRLLEGRLPVAWPHSVIHADDKSGALLAWEYFNPGTEAPMLIKHIDDYNRWVFSLKGTKEINKALWSFAPWSFSQWQEIIDDDNYGSMWSQGSAILRAHDQNVQSVVKGSARKCKIVIKTEQYGCTGEPGLAANCPPHLTSDVGHELANQSGTFGLCWTMGQSGAVVRCSLRSNGDYDVSAIARAFGGGGHRNAAGFEVDIQTLLGWLK